MYADHMSLAKSFLSSQLLQEEMIPAFSRVSKWLQTNKLSLNTVKTKHMTTDTSKGLNQLDHNPRSTLKH